MAHISDKEIQALATLSALRLLPQEIHDMACMVQSVLTYADSLAQVDDKTVNRHSMLQNRTCWMRPDEVRSWTGISLLADAPDSDGVFFIVPVILKQEQG